MVWARSSGVEHLPFKQEVGGSSPPALTKNSLFSVRIEAFLFSINSITLPVALLAKLFYKAHFKFTVWVL